MANPDFKSSMKHRGEMIFEATKDVFKMTPEQLKMEKRKRELASTDPVFRDVMSRLKDIKYSSRVIGNRIERKYGSPKTGDTKSRGTDSSAKRVPLK